jgi:para-aminobenzoate synthetase component 1
MEQADGPAIDPLDALARVADRPCLALLHGGAGGWSHLAWSDERAPLPPATLAAAAALGAAGGPAPGADPGAQLGRAWSGGFGGGALVRCDYGPGATLAALPVEAWASWDPAGACRLHARTRAGLARLHAGLARAPLPLPAPRLAGALVPAWDRAGHCARVERIRALIAAGDCYQVNLTLPFRGQLAPGAWRDAALFAALVRASPAPFAAFFRLPGLASSVSHSPECLLARRGARALSCPIKGTRRRLPGREAEGRAALLASAKDRAELAMIVDLVRNDLSRHARPGSVQVAEPARVLDLPYVHHLVADVACTPVAGDEALLDALLPAGSITGAPKRRVCAIIDALEAAPRGPYCGAHGWLGRDGCELAVAIRTVAIAGDAVAVHAGSGITADSDGGDEWDEVRAKAVAMAAALGGGV